MLDVWSELVTDLLELIVTSETLTIKDVCSFASVCQSWRSAAAATKHRRYRSPWLLFADKEDPNCAKFHDMNKNQIFSLPNQPSPPFANRYFIGSAKGWLITADGKSELFLLNPLTRQQIDLPPVTTMRNYVLPRRRNGEITGYRLRVDGGRVYYPADTLRYFLFERAALFMAGDYYMVAIYIMNVPNLAVARSGDKEWTVLNGQDDTTDIAFHDDGKLYVATRYFVEVKCWDFHKHEDLSLAKPELVLDKRSESKSRVCVYYIVRSPVGELLLVRRERYDGTDDEAVEDIPSDLYMRTVKIKVWRIDSCNDGGRRSDNNNKLVRLRSLGDYALFLGGHMSTCVSSKDYPELRPNCAYLSDEYLEHTNFYPRDVKDVGLFDLNDGSFQRILPHDSRLRWPSPTWFTPHCW